MARSSSRQIHGGTQLLSLRLAEQLGDAVRLDAAVDVIDYSGELVRIQYRDTLISAQKVIIAMMPLDADRIMFLPALPRQRAALQRAWMASPAMVVNVSYETPFWREQGLSGIAYSDSEYLAITFDQSPPAGSAGVIMGFANNDLGIPPRYDDRLAGTIRSLTKFLGEQARNALDFKQYDWDEDPMSAGAVSVLRPHVLTRFGPANGPRAGWLPSSGDRHNE